MSYASPISKLKVFAALGRTNYPESIIIFNKVKTSQGFDGSWGKPALVNGTAYVLYVLLEIGEPRNSKTVVNAAKWLLSKQRDDGGWTEIVPPPKYVEEVIPTDQSCTWVTAHVVQALIKASLKENPRVKVAVDYLKSCQNADGGWAPWRGGESVLSIMDYVVKALVDYGEAMNSWCVSAATKYTLSQKHQWTSFEASAVLPILLSVGHRPTDEATKACLKILAETQNEDGGWTYPGKTRGSDPELTAHVVYWFAKCGYHFELPLSK
jgi:squalene cyclase